MGQAIRSHADRNRDKSMILNVKNKKDVIPAKAGIWPSKRTFSYAGYPPKAGMTLFFILILAGCASPQSTPDAYLAGRGLAKETPARFTHCQGYGCLKKTHITMTDKDWTPFVKIFKPKPKNAEQERERITRAVGLFERKMGAITGTHADKAGTFGSTGPGQMDCVDESTNTTIYLSLLEQKELLKFHEVHAPTSRVPIIHAGSWPHQTAVIAEKKTGVLYAVDSWFRDNGASADIAPLKTWKEGWKPENLDDSRL